MSRPKMLFLFRTDANAEIGMGHFARCHTLALAFSTLGAEVEFVMSDPSQTVADRVRGAGASLHSLPPGLTLERDLELLLARCRETEAAGVVLDGYRFGQNYLDGLAETVFTVYFDELMEMEFNVAMVLNQNLYAQANDYSRGRPGRLLLGPEYAVLRDEFRRARPSPARSHPALAENLLITFGGTDPSNLASRALQGLAESDRRYHIKVVMGSLSPHIAQVAALAEASPHQVEMLIDINNMAQEMNWAHMALSASGTTTLEMNCLGLPQVLLIQVQNQIGIGEAAARLGLAVQLGWWEDVDGADMAGAVDQLAGDPDKRSGLSRRCMQAVDGRGAARTARAVMDFRREWRA